MKCESGKGKRNAQRNGPKAISFAVFALFCPLVQSHAQGTLQISFGGGLLPRPPGTTYNVTNYYESGMSFQAVGPAGSGNMFGRWTGGPSPLLYYLFSPNGTPYLQATLGDSLMFNFVDGSVFSLVSVDLAEYGTQMPDAVTFPFIGYRQDGSTVSVNFTTDGIMDAIGPLADFQTFYFGPEFSNLTRVEIPAFGWGSLDNLVVFVPEPSAVSLILLCGGVLFYARRRISRGAASPR